MGAGWAERAAVESLVKKGFQARMQKGLGFRVQGLGTLIFMCSRSLGCFQLRLPFAGGARTRLEVGVSVSVACNFCVEDLGACCSWLLTQKFSEAPLENSCRLRKSCNCCVRAEKLTYCRDRIITSRISVWSLYSYTTISPIPYSKH